MSKTNIVVSDDKRSLPDVQWINTPFSLLHYGKGFSLLQQRILTKVSEKIQDNIGQYYASGQYKGDRPSPLEVPTIQVSFSELGLSSGHYKQIIEAIRGIVNTSAEVLAMDETKEKKMIWATAFKKIELPVSEGSYVYEHTNKETNLVEIKTASRHQGTIFFDINPAFLDMSFGYINHPTQIAFDAKQKYAPLLYYLIKHLWIKGKRKVEIPFDELRDMLGTIKRDKEGNIIHDDFPLYSKFKQRVLDVAVEELKRMGELNQSDINVTYQSIYPGGKTEGRGNPKAVAFSPLLTKLGEFHNDPEKALAHMDIRNNDIPKATTTTRKRGRPRKNPLQTDNTPSLFDGVGEESITTAVILGDRVGEWKQLVQEYGDGPSSELLQRIVCEGTNDGAFSLVAASRDDVDAMSRAAVEDARLKSLLVRYVGRPFSTIKVGLSK